MFRLKEFSKQFTKIDPEFRYVAVAFLFACMIWASHILFLRDSILGKLVMVVSIIVLTMYHQVAGILAVLVVIAFMQNQKSQDKDVEGLTMSTDAMKQNVEKVDNPLTAHATPAPIQFASAAEFRDKYCMKGVSQTAGNEMPNYQYMLSPALFDDANGKPQFKLELIKQLNVPSFNEANSCKKDPPNSGSSLTIANMCDPTCKWTTNAITPTPTSTPVPTSSPKTEGFTPRLRPHIRTARHLITDGVTTLKSTANRLKRKLF